MANENNYKDYNESDFISDPFFQDWVINRNEENEVFWKVFFEAHPGKKAAGESARAFLQNLHFREVLSSEQVVQQSFARHLEDIRQYQQTVEANTVKKLHIRKWWKVAAIFALVAGMSTILMIRQKEKAIMVKNEYGNTRPVLLPDSSTVILNANSTIRFKKSWKASRNREVWLQGEAFFDVRKSDKTSREIQTPETFIVHTDDLMVSVLGTQFDIRERRGKTEIVLQSGKVMVSFNNNSVKDITMYPGDLIAYEVKNRIVTRSRTSPADFTAWKEKKLILIDPTAAEIVEYLEDYFGKQIVLENPALGKRKIDGPILLTNLDDALFILSTVLNTEINKKNNTITLKSR